MKLSERVINWTKEWFLENDRKTAVVGISGGKDSAVVAAILVHALGAENVFAVLMPNGEQSDISDSKQVVEELGIRNITVNIKSSFDGLLSEIKSHLGELSNEASINTAPRIRMSTLYAVAQTLSERDGAKACVVGTGNASEGYVGYCTKWGDMAHDVNLLKDLWVHEVIEIGDELGYFPNIIHKAPADGLSGSTDEEKLGVSYEEVYKTVVGEEVSEKSRARIETLHKLAKHKLNPIPYFKK